MKKLFAAAAALFCCMLLGLSASAAARGDVDLNGRIEAADARLVLRLAVEMDDGLSEESKTAADVDLNGTVEASDARLTLRLAVGLDTLNDIDAPQPDEPKQLSSKEIYQLASTFTFEVRAKTAAGTFLGTGFAYTADGQIVTNYHVISDAQSISVIDVSGDAYPVTQVIAFDRDIDLAIIKIDKTLTPATLCRSGYETGDSIYTLGSSSGHTGTFSYGVISNAAVTLPEYQKGMTYIQISAPISGGNSGGPLLDVYGRVIGVNTLSDDSGQNLNFSIPVSYLDALDTANPLTMEGYAEAERTRRTLTLAFGEEDLHMRVGGTAALVLMPFSHQTVTLLCESSTDCLKPTLSYRNGDDYAWLYIVAVGNCPENTVTVYMKEAPEVKCEIRVRVSPGGDLAFACSDGAPDLGAVTGVAPKELKNNQSLIYPQMEYDGNALQHAGYTASSLLERYTEALTEAGFEQTDSQSVIFGTVSSYIFTNAETGVTISYTEEKLFTKILRVTVVVY
ncbi:MAG: trypsin-like peptidase domain-containing protein [Clostridia bacterium]|nr:trypsin-like peptidase domain-containing protein [Clostridia bacterium]